MLQNQTCNCSNGTMELLNQVLPFLFLALFLYNSRMLNLIRYAQNLEIQHYFNIKVHKYTTGLLWFWNFLWLWGQRRQTKTSQNASITKHTDKQEVVRFVYQLLQPFYCIYLTSHLKISSIPSNIFKALFTTFPTTICLFLLILRKIFQSCLGWWICGLVRWPS